MSEIEKKKAVLWDCNGDNEENLSANEPNEAIYCYLDGCEPLPETIELRGYARLSVDPKRFKRVVLENAQEWLDEEYGGEDGHDINTVTEEALDNFISTYIKNYTPWQCEEVSREEINVKEWIEKHNPKWATGE